MLYHRSVSGLEPGPSSGFRLRLEVRRFIRRNKSTASRTDIGPQKEIPDSNKPDQEDKKKENAEKKKKEEEEKSKSNDGTSGLLSANSRASKEQGVHTTNLYHLLPFENGKEKHQHHSREEQEQIFEHEISKLKKKISVRS